METYEELRRLVRQTGLSYGTVINLCTIKRMRHITDEEFAEVLDVAKINIQAAYDLMRVVGKERDQ